MNIKIVAVILLVMLVTATGTVAATQNSTTRQSGPSMVRTYNSDDSDAGRGVPYTVKPVTNPQIQRGDVFISRNWIINPKLPVDANRNVYTGWRPKINIYSKPAIPTGEELETDNPVTMDCHEIEEPVKATENNNLIVNVTTDKDEYYTREPVNIKISLTNNGPDTVDGSRHCIGEPMKDPDAACLRFSSSKHADFCITTGRDRQVYLWSHDKGYAASFTGVTIKHGETREIFSATWNQKDINGNPVQPGKYYIDGWMVWSYYPTPYTIHSPIHGERISITIIEKDELERDDVGIKIHKTSNYKYSR